MTDEEVRNNYIQFGHPDGKQSFSIGIALPKLLITEGNGKYVLLFYGVLLGIVLPYLAGKWWYGTQAVTKDNVLVNSAANLFKEYDEEMSDAEVIRALGTGDEFSTILKDAEAHEGLGKVEKAIFGASDHIILLSDSDQASLRQIEDPVRRKTLALLWAYLGRVDLHNSVLDQGPRGPPLKWYKAD